MRTASATFGSWQRRETPPLPGLRWRLAIASRRRIMVAVILADSASEGEIRGVAAERLDPGVLVGGNGLLRELAADPVGRLGHDDRPPVPKRPQRRRDSRRARPRRSRRPPQSPSVSPPRLGRPGPSPGPPATPPAPPRTLRGIVADAWSLPCSPPIKIDRGSWPTITPLVPDATPATSRGSSCTGALLHNSSRLPA